MLESRLGPQYLPLRPLYGVGAVACTLLLHSSIKEPILIFLWCMLICSVVEYFASFVMEKAFGTVTWDYSDKLLNLHGRICLEYSCYWGLLALFVLYVLDRFLYGFVVRSEGQVGEIVLTLLLVLALLSVVVTLAALARIRRSVTILKASARGEVVTGSRQPLSLLARYPARLAVRQARSRRATQSPTAAAAMAVTQTTAAARPNWAGVSRSPGSLMERASCTPGLSMATPIKGT